MWEEWDSRSLMPCLIGRLHGCLMEWHGSVLFEYGCLECGVRVQSVTWAAIVGCPCGIHPHLNPLPSRERGIGCVVLFHPLIPVSGTGTGFDSSPIKGEGDWWVCLFTARPLPLPSGLRIKSAMTGTTHPPCGFPPTRE